MNWLQKMMYGRNGFDPLCIGVLVTSIVLMLIAQFTHLIPLDVFSLLLLTVCYFRAFSRNIYRRQAENRWFLGWWGPIGRRLAVLFQRTRHWFMGLSARVRGSKLYIYCKCPSCKQKIRLPRGKGTLHVSCPKCRNAFTRKT